MYHILYSALIFESSRLLIWQCLAVTLRLVDANIAGEALRRLYPQASSALTSSGRPSLSLVCHPLFRVDMQVHIAT